MAGNTWQLQEAKNKLSEVVRRAEREGPQFITVRGHEAVVVLSMEEYRKRKARIPETQQPGETLYHWFKRTGIMRPIGDDLVIERDPNDIVADIDIFRP